MNRKILTVIAGIAATLALSPLSLTACASNTSDEPNTTAGVDNPIDPSSPTTPNSTDNPSNSNDKKYSDILNAVLTDEYYLDKIKNNDAVYFYSDLDFAPYPYPFLKKQGHDISKMNPKPILDCSTEIYFIDDNNEKLYMSVLVENENDYYTNYILSCILSQQEYSEITMLFEGNYAEAPFYVQELSAQKDITIESKVNITKSMYEGVNSKFKILEVVKEKMGSHIVVDIIYASTEGQIVKTLIRTRPLSYSIIGKPSSHITDELRSLNIQLRPSNMGCRNNIYDIGSIRIKDATNLDEFKSVFHKLTYLKLTAYSAKNTLIYS